MLARAAGFDPSPPRKRGRGRSHPSPPRQRGRGQGEGVPSPSPRCVGRKVEASTSDPSPGSLRSPPSPRYAGRGDFSPRLLPRPRISGGEAGLIPRPRESGGEAGLIPRPRGSGGEAGLIPRPRGSGGEGRVRGRLPPSPRCAGRKVEASTSDPSPGSQVDTLPRLLPRPRASAGEAGLIPRPRGSGGEGRVRGCLPPSPRWARHARLRPVPLAPHPARCARHPLPAVRGEGISPRGCSLAPAAAGARGRGEGVSRRIGGCRAREGYLPGCTRYLWSAETKRA